MTITTRSRKPNVLLLYNESPDWPDSDKAWTARMVRMLSGALKFSGHRCQPLKVYDSLAALDDFDPCDWLVWNWGEELGGQPWTDSVIAAELDARGFAYTGSPAETLAFSIDRLNIKARLRTAGVPTPPARHFSDPSQAGEWTDFPAIVKGVTLHGSFGIERDSVVDTPEQLARRVAHMRAVYHCDSLVEPFLNTREFHVGVLGNGLAVPLLPVEYDYSAFDDLHDRLFTYQWKFDDTTPGYHAVRLRCPAPVDDRLRDRLQAVALAAYQALDVHDYGRIDMRLAETGDEPMVLDVNPNCDLDFTSVVIRGARAAGLAYHDVVARIVEWAAARMPSG